mmetsp:Transcript_12122/g.35066  ORF Transcript_12122/g.35066 Transcript_12122/m.35066 type:complete len:301 (-) Transcript_12122:2220-3122(-)
MAVRRRVRHRVHQRSPEGDPAETRGDRGAIFPDGAHREPDDQAVLSHAGEHRIHHDDHQGKPVRNLGGFQLLRRSDQACRGVQRPLRRLWRAMVPGSWHSDRYHHVHLHLLAPGRQAWVCLSLLVPPMPGPGVPVDPVLVHHTQVRTARSGGALLGAQLRAGGALRPLSEHILRLSHVQCGNADPDDHRLCDICTLLRSGQVDVPPPVPAPAAARRDSSVHDFRPPQVRHCPARALLHVDVLQSRHLRNVRGLQAHHRDRKHRVERHGGLPSLHQRHERDYRVLPEHHLAVGHRGDPECH